MSPFLRSQKLYVRRNEYTIPHMSTIQLNHTVIYIVFSLKVFIIHQVIT